jgi:hypothetical protein
VKTTIELPDELLKQAKARAARQGQSLKEVLTAALRDHLGRSPHATPGRELWRAVFGRARTPEVRAVDDVVAEDLEQIEADAWR